MYQNSTAGPDDQEIRLADVSKKIGSFFERISVGIFQFVLFVRKNSIPIALLFLIGAGVGLYMDKHAKMYENRLIVMPNFGSVDYLYSKIDLINAKIQEGDTLFLKNTVGIKNPKKFGKITIEPINDIYKFVEKTQNFELVKLMAEDGDVEKIIKDEVTAKNYSYHLISFNTKGKTTAEETTNPLMNYLNDSPYYKSIQDIFINNTKIKMIENDSIIRQINGFLQMSKQTINGQQKSSNLVYYNENTQLNDIINTKSTLIVEQANHRIEQVNYDRIIKDSSMVLNIRNMGGINSKMKFIVPILFVLLFFLGSAFKRAYKRRTAKLA